MVDPVDLALREDLAQPGVQLPGRIVIVAERLLDDHAPPGLARLRREAHLAEAVHDVAEEVGRGGQIEEDVAAGAVLLLDRAQALRQARVGLGGPEVAGRVVGPLAQPLPEVGIHVLGGEAAQVGGEPLPEGLAGHLRRCEPQDRELVAEEAAPLEVQEGGEELPLRQVSRGPEDRERAGIPGGSAPVAGPAPRHRGSILSHLADGPPRRRGLAHSC